jgi:hypothetical protein
MGLFETWVLHLGFFFHLNLQYPNLYLPLPIRFLGIHCNTWTYTYLYQLDFWAFITIPELILTSTNWIFGHSLQYLHSYLPLPTGILGHNCNTCTCTYFYQLEFWGLVTIPAFNTNIIIILCVCISHILCLLLGNNNNLCAILDFRCVLNTWYSKNLGYGFLHTKLILKQNS